MPRRNFRAIYLTAPQYVPKAAAPAMTESNALDRVPDWRPIVHADTVTRCGFHASRRGEHRQAIIGVAAAPSQSMNAISRPARVDESGAVTPGDEPDVPLSRVHRAQSFDRSPKFARRGLSVAACRRAGHGAECR